MRLALLGLLLASPASAQVSRRLVLDLEKVPIVGAEVLIGDNLLVTDREGAFRLDGIVPGSYQLTVRKIGYHPHRGRIEVKPGQPGPVIYLSPAAVLLPPVIVDARRTGFHGFVRDSALRPAAGAVIRLLGVRGGQARADSLGGFSFPRAGGGDYLVQVSFPGHQERRFSVSLPADSGREVTVALGRAVGRPPGTRERWALQDLDRRLAWSQPRYVLTREELARFGFMSLCDIPEIRSAIGSSGAWGIVDGWRRAGTPGAQQRPGPVRAHRPGRPGDRPVGDPDRPGHRLQIGRPDHPESDRR